MWSPRTIPDGEKGPLGEAERCSTKDPAPQPLPAPYTCAQLLPAAWENSLLPGSLATGQPS